ncbi:MAG: MlaD family protein [Planctomycetota bacterium]
MASSRAERVLGVLVVIGVVAALWSAVEAIHDRYWPKVYRVVAYFEDARGIAEGTPIRIAGVRAGWVLEIIPPGFDAPAPTFDLTGLPDAEKQKRVKIVLGILDPIRIHTHKVRVASMGLIQERYLAIDVGHEDPVPRSGAAVLGELDVSLDSVGDAARNVQGIFSDSELQQRIGRFGDEMKGLIGGFNRIVERGPDALKRAQGTFRVVGDDANAMIEASSDAIARTQANSAGISDQFGVTRERIERVRSEFQALSEAAKEMQGHVESGKGNLGRFASDPSLSESIEGVSGAKTKLAYDRSKSEPMSKGTRSLLKAAKAILFFLEPSDK